MIYAIHNDTKRHFVIDEETHDWDGPMGEYRFVEATTYGWIEWQGESHESPAPPESQCRIRLSDGTTFTVIDPEDWDWSKGGDQWIVAYRPTLDADTKPESPAWGGEGLPPVGCDVEHPTGRGTVMLPPDVNGVTIIQSIEAGSDGEYKRVAASACRPILSEEDQFVDEMVNSLRKIPIATTKYVDIARALYRAGYRKENPQCPYTTSS